MADAEKKTTYVHQLSADEKQYALSLFDEVRSLGHQDSLTWQLESIKHLAVINGAGLAASIAAAGAWLSKEAILRAAVQSCGLCVIGLSLAVMLMIWRWVWGTKQAQLLIVFRVNFAKGQVPIEHFDSLVASKTARVVSWGAGALSLALFLAAMAHIVVAILYK
jgi:hypothetical protein